MHSSPANLLSEAKARSIWMRSPVFSTALCCPLLFFLSFLFMCLSLVAGGFCMPAPMVSNQSTSDLDS